MPSNKTKQKKYKQSYAIFDWGFFHACDLFDGTKICISR